MIWLQLGSRPTGEADIAVAGAERTPLDSRKGAPVTALTRLPGDVLGSALIGEPRMAGSIVCPLPLNVVGVPYERPRADFCLVGEEVGAIFFRPTWLTACRALPEVTSQLDFPALHARAAVTVRAIFPPIVPRDKPTRSPSIIWRYESHIAATGARGHVAHTDNYTCFRKAGWRPCGRNADGRLTILEIYPPASPAVSVARQAAEAARATGWPDLHEPKGY